MKKKLRARFRVFTVVQVLALVPSTGILAWSLLDGGYTAVPLVIGAVVLLQIIGLLRYVEAHVDSLEEFFATINYEDFTRRFVEDDVDAELKGAFNRIIERFQEARAERDVQAGYLETVVKHVPVPFIAARADGSLSLVNNPARRLTGLPALRHLRDFAELDEELPSMMRDVEAGQQQLLQAKIRGVPVELRVSVSEIRMQGQTERLYSIENLSGELAARESSAWRNLIRVLTHEIMNTLTPVTSLAQTTAGMLDVPDATDDIREAVQTISRRSAGLMTFVSKYRELLKVPQPNPTDVVVAEALQGIVTLLGEQLEDVAVEFDVQPASLTIRADPAMLDQVLLNVVKNACEAMDGGGKLKLTARLDYGRVVIGIADDGPGIEAHAEDQVFVPFFTTKRDGSGIGLSLCRQIMTAHGGEIALESGPGGTLVRLVF